jgi:3-hydroxyisobutyrate dehydrogenase-like beta-hydroxyacid dehydrogenase
MNMPVIGFVGLGVMGEPMCRNVRVRGGYRVIATDLDAAPMARLGVHGVEAGHDIGAVVRGSDVVFASLPSGRVLEALLRGRDGVLDNLRAGQVFVDLGT